MNNHIVGGIIFVITWRVIGFKSAVVVTIAYYYGGGINGTGTGININGTDIDLFNRPSIDSSVVEGDIVGDNDTKHTTDDHSIDVKSEDVNEDASIENHVDEYEIDDRYIADKEIEGSVDDNDDSELEDFTGSDLDVPSEVPSDIASTTFEDLFIPTEQTAYSDALSDTTVDFDNIRESDYGRTNEGTISSYDGPDFGDDPESTDNGVSDVPLEKPYVRERTDEEKADYERFASVMRGKTMYFMERFMNETSYTSSNIDSVNFTDIVDLFAVRDGLFIGDNIYNNTEVSNFKQFFYNIYDFFSSFFDDASTKATKELVKTVVSNEPTINFDLQKLSTEVHIVDNPESFNSINIHSEVEKIKSIKNVSDKIEVEYFLGYDSGTGKCISNHIPELLAKSADAFVKLHESSYSGIVKGLTYENGNSLVHDALKNTFYNYYRYESYKDIVNRDYKELANIKETLQICQRQLVYPVTYVQDRINSKMITNELASLIESVMDRNVVANSDQSLTIKSLTDSSDTLADIVVRKLEKSEGAMNEVEKMGKIYDKAFSSRVLKRASYHAVLYNNFDELPVFNAFSDLLTSGIDTDIFKDLGESRFDGFEQFKAIK